MDDFNAELKNVKDKLIVVEFFHPYSKVKSTSIDATLDQLAEKYASKLVVLKINIDESEPELFSLVRGSEFPKFHFYKKEQNGVKIVDFSGADVKKLEQTVAELIN